MSVRVKLPETSLILIINDILIYLDNKAQCYIVLLDLSIDFYSLELNIHSI